MWLTNWDNWHMWKFIRLLTAARHKTHSTEQKVKTMTKFWVPHKYKKKCQSSYTKINS